MFNTLNLNVTSPLQCWCRKLKINANSVPFIFETTHFREKLFSQHVTSILKIWRLKSESWKCVKYEYKLYTFILIKKTSHLNISSLNIALCSQFRRSWIFRVSYTELNFQTELKLPLEKLPVWIIANYYSQLKKNLNSLKNDYFCFLVLNFQLIY